MLCVGGVVGGMKGVFTLWGGGGVHFLIGWSGSGLLRREHLSHDLREEEGRGSDAGGMRRRRRKERMHFWGRNGLEQRER